MPPPLRRDDDILLDRLKDEPPLKKHAPLALTLGIVAGALALGIVLFFAFRKPEVFVNTTPQLSEHPAQDTSQLATKRRHLAPMIDSIETLIRTGAEDPTAELALANLYYDGEYWDKALAGYEH